MALHVDTHNPAVVVPTVTRIAAVADVDASLGEGETRALQQVDGVLARRKLRVHVLRKYDTPAGDVDALELMVHRAAAVADLAHHVDDSCGGVDDRRAGDSERIDVAASGFRVDAGQWRAERDRPEHSAVRGVEGDDAIVLGGGNDAPARDYRLAEDRAAEVGGPCFGRRVE